MIQYSTTVTSGVTCNGARQPGAPPFVPTNIINLAHHERQHRYINIISNYIRLRTNFQVPQAICRSAGETQPQIHQRARLS